jgi:hypothetical protein
VVAARFLTRLKEAIRVAERKQQQDAGEAQVQSAFDEANAKGYFGETPDGPENKAFSLESGPDSPAVHEQLAKGA